MSAVELAVSKVRKLSDRQARELLGWLDKRQVNGATHERQSASAARRKAKIRRHLFITTISLAEVWNSFHSLQTAHRDPMGAGESRRRGN